MLLFLTKAHIINILQSFYHNQKIQFHLVLHIKNQISS